MDFLQKTIAITFVITVIALLLTWVASQVKSDPFLPMLPGLIAMLSGGMCILAFVLKVIGKVMS